MNQKRIIIVTGSVRKNNLSEKIAQIVQAQIKKHDEIEARVVNMRELNLPMLDTPFPPLSDQFDVDIHPEVRQWHEAVLWADGIIFLCPEYNRMISPVLVNALDWLGREFRKKSAGIISYGSVGGVYAAVELKKFAARTGMNIGRGFSQIRIEKDMASDGQIVDQKTVEEQIEFAIQSATSEK